MQLETPPTEKPYDKSEGERRGLVIVNTGDGKGKSTAAFGLALRAHGRGKAVKIFQFMKVPTARFGEHRMFEQLGIPIEGLGDGFSWKSQDLEHSAQLARDGWQKASAAILSGAYFMVTLDEITYPLIYGWMPLEDVLQTLRQRPAHVGRGALCPQLAGRRLPARCGLRAPIAATDRAGAGAAIDQGRTGPLAYPPVAAKAKISAHCDKASAYLDPAGIVLDRQVYAIRALVRITCCYLPFNAHRPNTKPASDD